MMFVTIILRCLLLQVLVCVCIETIVFVDSFPINNVVNHRKAFLTIGITHTTTSIGKKSLLFSSLRSNTRLSSTSSDDNDDDNNLGGKDDDNKLIWEKLNAQSEDGKKRYPPPGSISRIDYTDAGTMIITIPPKGIATDSLFAAAFSVAWFSAIAPATFAAGAVPIASRLFMLPFWFAGGVVGSSAFVGPFVSSKLSIGQYAWSQKNKYLGAKYKSTTGATEDLSGAVTEVVAVVNGVPRYELRLCSQKDGIITFGQSLSGTELEYLAEEINRHLNSIRESPETLSLP